MIKLPVCTSVCIGCISGDSLGQTPRVLLASWPRSWPQSALICLLLRWWRQTSGSPLSLVQVYCSESPASVLWMRKLSTRADGLLELLVALASGSCKLKFRRICPSRSYGLQMQRCLWFPPLLLLGPCSGSWDWMLWAQHCWFTLPCLYLRFSLPLRSVSPWPISAQPYSPA